MNQYDIVSDVFNEIYRLDSLLKAMRCAAFDQIERLDQKDSLSASEFPVLFDIALDRVSLLKDHTDKVAQTIKLILKGGEL